MKNLAPSAQKGYRTLQVGLPKKFRRAGNAARDRKDWAEAARCYREYLRFVPKDAPIWVQFGHSLKEHGKLEEAEQAYRTAADLAPTDAELRIHYGDLLKRLGFKEKAAEVLLESMRLEPTWGMVEDLSLLNQRSQALNLVEESAENSRNNMRYLELKDLFQYLSLHSTVTGITRVVLSLIKYLLDDLDKAEAENYQFVHMFGDAEAVALISKEKLRRLVQLATAEAGGDLPTMQALIRDTRKTAKLIHLKAGDLYFMPGAFWEFVGNPAWLLSKKQKGVYIGGFIYDLIPLTHSHFCMASLSDMFNIAFADTSRFYDFTFSISEFVATQVKDFVKAHGITPFPVTAVPLAHELHFETSRRATGNVPETSRIQALTKRPFVLCVCTIEARKNHVYLFYIWQMMIDAGLDVPDLVFVGRPGWRVADLLGQIEASRYLENRLHVVHGLSDTELATLYDRCMFTVFPSFVEGWGLPVGESLAYGKVCVASSITSIPEVGGEFALYIDPFNLHSGYEVISKLITEPALLQEMEDKIRTRFVARTWKDVGRDFFQTLDRACASLGPAVSGNGAFAPHLEPGFLLDMKWLEEAGARRREYAKNPSRLVLVDGWRGIEGTGTWMLDRTAKIHFTSRYEVGRELSILVLLSTSQWVSDEHTLRLWASKEFVPPSEPGSERHHTQTLLPDTKFWVKLKGKVEEPNIITIQLQMDGPPITPIDGAAPIAVRLHSVGYSAIDDHAARMDLLAGLETRLFKEASVVESARKNAENAKAAHPQPRRG
jgi:glycosyltransferase involved in cell wall biosynthesis